MVEVETTQNHIKALLSFGHYSIMFAVENYPSPKVVLFLKEDYLYLFTFI